MSKYIHTNQLQPYRSNLPQPYCNKSKVKFGNSCNKSKDKIDVFCNRSKVNESKNTRNEQAGSSKKQSKQEKPSKQKTSKTENIAKQTKGQEKHSKRAAHQTTPLRKPPTRQKRIGQIAGQILHNTSQYAKKERLQLRYSRSSKLSHR